MVAEVPHDTTADAPSKTFPRKKQGDHKAPNGARWPQGRGATCFGRVRQSQTLPVLFPGSWFSAGGSPNVVVSR